MNRFSTIPARSPVNNLLDAIGVPNSASVASAALAETLADAAAAAAEAAAKKVKEETSKVTIIDVTQPATPKASEKRKPRVSATKKSAASAYIDAAAVDDDEEASGDDDGGHDDDEDLDGFIAASPAKSANGFSHAAVNAALARQEDSSPRFVASRKKAKLDDKRTTDLPVISVCSPPATPSATAATTETTQPTAQPYQITTLPIPAIALATIGVKPQAVTATAAAPEKKRKPAQKKLPTANGKAPATAPRGKAKEKANGVSGGGDDDTADTYVFNHVFGKKMGIEALSTAYQVALSSMVGDHGIDAGAALAYCNEMGGDVEALLETQTMFATMAQSMLVFCRSHLVDQALGITAKTSSVPDKETLVELTRIADQRARLSAAVAEVRVANCSVLAKDRCIDLPSHARELPFMILDACGAFLTLDVGRHSNKTLGDAVHLHSNAVALLGDTRSHRSGYKQALTHIRERMPSCGLGRNIIDVDLKLPWLLLQPRMAVLKESTTRRKSFPSTPLTYERTLSARHSAEKTSLAAVSIPPPASATPMVTSATTPKSNLQKRVTIADPESSVAQPPVKKESTMPSTLSVSSAQVLADLSMQPLIQQPQQQQPLGWRKQGDVTLVGTRWMAVRDISESLKIYMNTLVVVPNTTMIKLFGYYLRAQQRALDWDALFVVLGKRRLRGLDARNPVKESFAPNNLVSCLFTSLADFSLPTADSVERRMQNPDQPFTATEKLALQWRKIAQDYIAGVQDDNVAQIYLWDLAIMHVLVSFLRVDKRIFLEVDVQQPSTDNARMLGPVAVLEGVRLSVDVRDTRGEPIVLRRNEIPAQCDIKIPPLMAQFLTKMYARYIAHLEATTSFRSTSPTFATDFADAYRSVRFAGDSAWLASFLATPLSQTTPEMHNEFRSVFVPIMHSLFPCVCYNMSSAALGVY